MNTIMDRQRKLDPICFWIQNCIRTERKHAYEMHIAHTHIHAICLYLCAECRFHVSISLFLSLYLHAYYAMPEYEDAARSDYNASTAHNGVMKERDDDE